MHAHTIYTYISPLIYNENGRQKHTFAFSKCFGYKVLASKGKYDERQEFCGKLPIDSAGIAWSAANSRNHVLPCCVLWYVAIQGWPILRFFPFLFLGRLSCQSTDCIALISSRKGHFERLTAPFTSLILTLCFAYSRETKIKNTRFMCPFGRLIVTKPTSILHGPILGVDHLLGT